MRRRRSIPLGVFVLVIFLFAPSVFANTDDARKPRSPAGASRARVVSLSLVEGTVITRAPGSTKWTLATLDTPIEEGVSLATAKHSFVEVQFEDGSTIRLGEISCIEFAQLELAPRGAYINHFKLDVGTATIHVVSRRHEQYALNVSGVSLATRGKSEFRTDLTRGHLRVEVFQGQIQAADSDHSEKLRKNDVVFCDRGGSGAFQETSSRIQPDEWDNWVHARDVQSSLAWFTNQRDPIYSLDGLVPYGGAGQPPAWAGY
ncbi:MAG: FecR domain-containing protein [Candidatus Acidiferrales bacterium]